MFQGRWQHFRLHHLERGVQLVAQFGIVGALRIGQFDGQGFHANGFVGKNQVEAEIEEIRPNIVMHKSCSFQEVQNQSFFGGAGGAHDLVDEDILLLGYPIILRFGQMRHHPSRIVGSSFVRVKKQLKQFLLKLSLSQAPGVVAADSVG